MIKKMRNPEAVLALLIVFCAAVVLYRSLKPRKLLPHETPLLLDSLVAHVEDELWRMDSTRVAAERYPMFDIDEVQLEVSFVVKENHSSEQGLSYELLAVTDKSEFGAEKTNTVTLRLKPVRAQPTSRSQQTR